MKKILTIAILATALLACKKDSKNEIPVIVPDAGLLVLNEGSSNQNNASISYYDFETKTVTQDMFFAQNERHLGDVANDILVYGGKIYITVGFSSTVEVTDLNLKSIERISLTDGAKNREPHGLACHNGKVYIACFDGYVARLDTSSLSIENYVKVGDNPENICISNDFAYVTNSGGMNYLVDADHDSTVSVIDLNTFTETEKIIVGKNPFSIGTDENGNVIVGCRGDYGMTTPFSLVRINTNDHSVHTFTDVMASDFSINKSTIYFYNTAYDADWNVIGIDYTAYNTTNGNKANLLTNSSLITMPYAININQENEDIYVSDAIDYTNAGRAFIFDKNGEKQFDFETGISPKKIVVLKK
jgi:YVTN family beta-propeller protein